MKKISINPLFLWIVLLLSIFLIVSKAWDLSQKFITNSELVSEYNALELKREESEKELETIKNTESREMYYRQEYHISEDGEILFIFPEENESEKDV